MEQFSDSYDAYEKRGRVKAVRSIFDMFKQINEVSNK